MTDLSPAAWAVLCAYRDFSWTPDEEDNSRYYRFSHKAGMAAALRAAVDHVVPSNALYARSCCEFVGEQCRAQLLAIADELEVA